jgi:hypothetical protein
MTGQSDAGRPATIHAGKRNRETWPGTWDWGEVEPMLFIAVGLTLALVAMDFLDLTKISRS